MNDNIKSGFVTIVGRPNVGKSTLMNRMIGQKIAITSNKPQTTRNRIRTVYTDERGQIIFFDTPGMNKPKNKLGRYMRNETNYCMNDADVICYLVEPYTFIGDNEEEIISILKNIDVPIILIINKTDMVKKDDILPIAKIYSSRLNLTDVIPVSARNGSNIDELLSAIFSQLPEGPLYYDEDTVTDQPVKVIAAEIIREKALHALNEEIPHGIAVIIEKFKKRAGKESITDIESTVYCERESHKGIIIGKNGSMLKKIGSNARFELERELNTKVNLQLFVKVNKDWRDNSLSLKNFGYIQDQ